MFTICDRLKQRYGNSQQNWELFSKEKNNQDFEYIQYIVNFIIEQAKHNIVISELPDVIRTLHCEAETILRNNRMITLQEVIAQVQRVGAMKYPYLKRLKPISTEDFVKEVLREVFDRLGTIITLDMIGNISRFTTCSAKQLLQAMPAIDVNEAATLIIEDISRNQRDHQKQTSSSMNRQVDRKLGSMPAPVNKERIKSEQDSLRSIQNSNQSLKNINKNQQSRSTDFIGPTSHFTQTILENPLITKRRHKSMKKHESSPIETDEKMVNVKPDRNIRKSIVKEQLEHQKTELLPISNNQKIRLSRSKSNTRTYSIHSEEGLSAQKHIKQIPLHTISSTETVSLSHDHPSILETMHGADRKTSQFPLKMPQSIRYYSKYCYQHSDISDNEEQITENCPLEDILNHRFLQPI